MRPRICGLDTHECVFAEPQKKEFAENPIKSKYQSKLIVLCIILH